MTFVHLTGISTRLSFMGARPRLAGGGGGVAVPGGGTVPYARGGVVARKFRIKRLKETILQQSIDAYCVGERRHLLSIYKHFFTHNP